jgi:hypothetical protein
LRDVLIILVLDTRIRALVYSSSDSAPT